MIIIGFADQDIKYGDMVEMCEKCNKVFKVHESKHLCEKPPIRRCLENMLLNGEHNG